MKGSIHIIATIAEHTQTRPTYHVTVLITCTHFRIYL